VTGRAAALRVKTRAALPALGRATARVWREPGPAERYAEYLFLMHAVVRASVPLMQQARSRCAELAPADPIAAPLAAYLAEHSLEERDHDTWLLADLRAVGRDPDDALRRVPPPVVAELVGAQYYWLLHHHPVALLGYVAVLEEQPGAPELPDALERLTGLPPAGFRTLREHVAEDPEHRARLDLVLDALPLTPEHEALVALSALHTVAAATRLFTWLADRRLIGVTDRAG
jgi:hypothetical protein